jgi:hypothetical protein
MFGTLVWHVISRMISGNMAMREVQRAEHFHGKLVGALLSRSSSAVAHMETVVRHIVTIAERGELAQHRRAGGEALRADGKPLIHDGELTRRPSKS